MMACVMFTGILVWLNCAFPCCTPMNTVSNGIISCPCPHLSMTASVTLQRTIPGKSLLIRLAIRQFTTWSMYNTAYGSFGFSQFALGNSFEACVSLGSGLNGGSRTSPLGWLMLANQRGGGGFGRACCGCPPGPCDTMTTSGGGGSGGGA